MTARNRYRVSIPEPHSHLLCVEARWDELEGDAALELEMAVWTPGSYLIREYARHVQELTCQDEAGLRLSVTKTAKNVWRVARGAAKSVIARYQVYAHELTVRTNHCDDSHAFWNGAPTYLYLNQRRHEACEVVVSAPTGWQVATGLPPSRADVAGQNSFLARNLDELIDSPFECGKHAVHEFTAQSRRHRIAIWGQPDGSIGFDIEALKRDVTAIIDAHAGLFGGVPYDEYLFILQLAAGAYGGLEHRASTTLLSSPTTFHPRKRYEELLELISHEYFHLWNVKRIRPRALGPFDYSREAYTRSLWVMEGVTSYYDRLALRRAGLLPASRYLERLAEEWGKLLAVPGRALHSLAESSFDAWIKAYRPDENTVNSTVSYYLKGSLVVLALDLEIRERSGGKRSLDDVMRLLWQRFGNADAGFEDGDARALFEEAAQLDLQTSFARLVDGRGEIDLAERLAFVGLELKADWEGRSAGETAVPPWLGAKLVREPARTMISQVPTGTPAELGGLYAGDELLALDGYKVDDRTLRDRLASRRVGDVVRLTVFRRERLVEVSVTLGERPRDRFEIVARENASEGQRALYAGWMGEPLPPPKRPS